MYDRFELQFVDGSKYLSSTRQVRRSMVPEGAGIYVWSSQLARSFDANDLPAGDLLSELQKNLGKARGLRRETARVGKYRRVEMFDDPVGLTEASTARLDYLLTVPRDELSWVLLCASLFQRPLYVGKTVNFRARMAAHFGFRTNFTKSLRELDIPLASCVVTLCPLSLEGTALEVDNEDYDDEDGAARETWESTGDGDDWELDDLIDEEEESVPLSADDTNNIVKLAESIVIRTSHPLFNEKMD